VRWSLRQLIGSWRSATAPQTDDTAWPEGPDERPGSGVVSPGSSTTGPVTPVPGPSAEWRDVPPIRRTLPSMPITSRAAFPSSVAGRRQPDPILRPLRHASGGGGPAGFVRTTALSQAGTGAQPAGVSRPPVAVREEGAGSGPEPARTVAGEPPMGPKQDEAGVERVPRHLSVASGPPDASRALTEVTDVPDLGLGRRGRAARSESEPSRAMMTEAPARGPAPLPVPDAPPGGDSASHRAPADRLTLGQARRLGLGAPLARVPVGSHAAPAGIDRTDAGAPVVGSAAAGRVIAPPRQSDPLTVPAATEAPLLRGREPVPAPVSATPSSDPQPASSDKTAAPRVAAGGAGHPLAMLRVRPTGHSTSAAPDVAGGPVPAAASLGMASAVDVPRARRESVSEGADAPAVVTRAGPAEAAAVTALRGASRVSPGSATPATGVPVARPLVGSHGDVRVSIQRRTIAGGVLVPGEPGHGAGATIPARPATGVPGDRHHAAVSGGAAAIRHPAPERDEQDPQNPGATSARPSAPATGAVPENPFRSVARVAQRTPVAPATSAPLPSGSRSAVAQGARSGSGMAPVPPADRVSPVSFQRGAPGPGPAGPAAPGLAGPAAVQRSVTVDEMSTDVEPPHDRERDRESDEQMAGRLYDGIRRRLVADLLLDRERAGLLADMRS
jgi:hypothetical protein